MVSSPTTGAADAANNITVPTTEAKYACMLCRKALFCASDVIPHEKGIESLHFLKRAKNDVEFDNNNIIFVKELKWLKNCSDKARVEAEDPLTTAGISCPGCDAKIGKWHLPAEWDGMSDDTPTYVLVRKRLDVVVNANDAQKMAGLVKDYELGDGEEEVNVKRKKKQPKKKQQKDRNTSNMGSFRNKSYGVQHKKEKET